MKIVFERPVPVRRMVPVFDRALKEASCEHVWIPHVISTPMGGDALEKGIVAYLESKGKENRGLRIVLQPILEQSKVVTKASYVFIEFGVGISANPRWGTKSHPKRNILHRKYAKDFDAIIKKFCELLAEMTSTRLSPVLSENR